MIDAVTAISAASKNPKSLSAFGPDNPVSSLMTVSVSSGDRHFPTIDATKTAASDRSSIVAKLTTLIE